MREPQAEVVTCSVTKAINLRKVMRYSFKKVRIFEKKGNFSFVLVMITAASFYLLIRSDFQCENEKQIVISTSIRLTRMLRYKIKIPRCIRGSARERAKGLL